MFWDDLLEIAAIIGITLLAIALVACLCMGGAYVVDRWQCATYETVTGKETKFAAMSCYVQTDTGWQTWGEYTTRAIASEGLKAEPANE